MIDEPRVIALYERACAMRRRGDVEAALRLLDEARSLSENDLGLLVPILNEQALGQKQSGDNDGARRTCGELIALFHGIERQNLRLYGAVLDNVGYIEREAGDLVAALNYHEAAVAALREADEQEDLAHALMSLAVVQKDHGQLQQARISIAEALSLAGNDDASLLGAIRTVFGLVHQTLREWDGARREFIGALVAYRSAGDLENFAVALHNLATVDYERDRKQTAMRLLRRAIHTNQKIRSLTGLSNDLWRLGLYAADTRQINEGRKLLLRARRYARRSGDHLHEARVELDIARVAMLNNESREARKHTNAALAIASKLGAPFLIHEILLTRAAAWRHLQQPDQSRIDLEGAIDALERVRAGAVTEELTLRLLNEESDAHHALVQLSMETNDPRGAWAAAEQTRGRELLRRVRRSPSLASTKVPEELLSAERILLEDFDSALAALELGASAEAYQLAGDAERELRQLWLAMKPLDPEYVSLRMGEPVTYDDFRVEIEEWSDQIQSPIRTNGAQ